MQGRTAGRQHDPRTTAVAVGLNFRPSLSFFLYRRLFLLYPIRRPGETPTNLWMTRRCAPLVPYKTKPGPPRCHTALPFVQDKAAHQYGTGITTKSADDPPFSLFVLPCTYTLLSFLVGKTNSKQTKPKFGVYTICRVTSCPRTCAAAGILRSATGIPPGRCRWAASPAARAAAASPSSSTPA